MPDPATILHHLGIGDVETIEPVSGGSDAALYRVRRHGESLALRVLQPAQHGQSRNENEFLKHATSHGIPGPSLVATGLVESCPATVTTWIDGQTLAARLLGTPDYGDLPEQFAAIQRQIHGLPLQTDVAPSIVWSEGLPGDLIAALEAESTRPATIVHLDYHPFNVMECDDRIVAVLDWSNACVADPRYDLARTLAILTHAPVPDPSMKAAIDAFTMRYQEAYDGDPVAPVFRWWAGVTMLDDLLPKRDHPALRWVTEEWIAGVNVWIDIARVETMRQI